MGELRELNQQNKLAVWAERVAECRASGQSVLSWCKEHGICSQTYYKWQKRLYTLVEAQQEVQFAEVTAPAVDDFPGRVTEFERGDVRHDHALEEIVPIEIRKKLNLP